MCKEFVKVEEEKIDSEEYDIMGNIEFGKETGILKYCLLEQVSILLHIAIPNDVHNIIHTLLTLRTGVACMLYKILHKYEGMLNKLRYEDVQRCIDGKIWSYFTKLGHETTYKQERAQCEDENEDNELSEVEGNLNNEIREGDEESDNGSNESDTIIELYELDGYEND
ncbi:852_t:CDS:2 [Entrophospora sp. SA101]|nr:852_t:CDS:2 [Entrophospora sp. SA101]